MKYCKRTIGAIVYFTGRVYKSSSSYFMTWNQLGNHIEVFKIIKNKYDYKVVPELIHNINKITRGNDFRLSKNRSHYTILENFRLLIELLTSGTVCQML